MTQGTTAAQLCRSMTALRNVRNGRLSGKDARGSVHVHATSGWSIPTQAWRALTFSARLTVGLWLIGAILATGATPAHAASFYWYGESDSTCWQTGQLGSSSTACDSVGPGFLATPGSLKGGLAHVDEVSTGGSAEGITLPDGDYCNYYKLGDDISKEESNNQGGYTGYTPPTPYTSYQESDSYGNSCQADGTTWGQEVGTGDPSNNCYNTCGMHHIVSFHELSDRPWASWFGEPSLAVSTEALIHTVTFGGESSYNMAWGYVCPLLKDTTTGDILEYCLEEWRSIHNPPEWKEERIGTCGPNGYDTVVTYFWPGTKLATEQAGSANTLEFSGTPSGWTHFAAAITKSDLLTAIDLAREPPTVKNGCGTNFSTNPEQYALVGVEQGVEGEHKLSGIGGAGRNLQVRTEYTPLVPSATSESPTAITPTGATLNGTVDPHGFDTHYYFEYGLTTSYGSRTPEVDAGSGDTPMAVNATIGGLVADTTYQYRLVAANSAGSVVSGDATFSTAKRSFTGAKPADFITCANDEYAVAVSNGKELGASGTAVWAPHWACNSHAVVGDFNGDGLDDIAVPDVENSTWAVGLSNGSSFGLSGTGTWLTHWTAYPEWSAAGDFTGNGMDDLIVCSNNEYSVAVSNGKELGASGSGLWLKAPCKANVVVGDFNGDGKDDLAIPNESNNSWTVELSNGSSFGSPGSGTWLSGWTAKPAWASAGEGTGGAWTPPAGGWTSYAVPDAAGAANNRLTGVSCQSSTVCVATAYELYNGVTYAYGEIWENGVWTIHSVNGNGGMELNGISCTSSTTCTAVGSLAESNGNIVTVAERWNGTEWTRQTTPNEPGLNSDLASVSCISTCTAVGSDTNDIGTWAMAVVS